MNQKTKLEQLLTELGVEFESGYGVVQIYENEEEEYQHIINFNFEEHFVDVNVSCPF